MRRTCLGTFDTAVVAQRSITVRYPVADVEAEMCFLVLSCEARGGSRPSRTPSRRASPAVQVFAEGASHVIEGKSDAART